MTGTAFERWQYCTAVALFAHEAEFQTSCQCTSLHRDCHQANKDRGQVASCFIKETSQLYTDSVKRSEDDANDSNNNAQQEVRDCVVMKNIAQRLGSGGIKVKNETNPGST